MKKILLFLAFCCCFSGFSQPGSVDTTFNSDVINFGVGPVGAVRKSALLPADRIAIMGDLQLYNGFDRRALAILNADGSLYHDFNPDFTAGDQVTAFFAQPDGKYVVAGNITYGGIRLRRVVRLNADGSFDSMFHYSLSTGFDANVECLTLLPDGKIIVGGTFANYESATAKGIVCLNSDGTINTSFNSSGVGFNVGGQVFDSQTQPDGKVVLVGSFATYNGANRRNVLRINQDGSLDTGFTVGTGATMWTPGGTTANAVVYAVAMQSTGKILIGGDFEEYNGIVTKRIARLNTNGTRDPFDVSSGSYGAQEQQGTVTCIRVMANDKVIMAGDIYLPDISNIILLSADGVEELSFIPSNNALIHIINTAEAQSDGKVVGYGVIEDAATNFRPFRRFNTNGTVDLSFNPFNGTDGNVLALKALSSGKIILGGAFYQYRETPTYGMAVVDSDGNLDPSFHVPVGMDIVTGIEEQPDGKIVMLGAFGELDGHSTPGIARLHADGNVDTSFNPAIFTWGGPLGIQPDGKILMIDTDSELVRLNTDGSLDNTFTSPFSTASISTISVQADGKILVSGALDTGSGTFRLARLNTDGSIDSGFAIGSGPNQSVAIGFQSDGKMIIVGNFTSFNGNPANRILRLNPDGSTDDSFDTGSGPNAAISGILLQPNGKILLSGNFTMFNSSVQNRMVRLLPNGNLDLTFNVGEGAGIHSMSLQADGKIVIGGEFVRFDQTSAMNIIRLIGDEPVDNAIEITGISAAILCAGQNATVDFNATGTFDSGNIFTAELSDASGNFISPTTVGSVSGIGSGTINIAIPIETDEGTNYKIRVSASNPAVTSEPSSTFEINAPAIWYVDTDADGFGDTASSTTACGQPEDFVSDNTDCDDSSASVHPGATEIAFNGVDEDCNGTIDDGSQVFSQVLPSQCGTTLSSIGTLIGAVSYGSPVNGYRFKVVNNGDLSEQTIDRNVPNFQLTQLPNYDYAVTYTISVMLKRNGIWLNYYGPSCQISTPAILDPGGSGAIDPSQCNTSLASLSTLIATTSLAGVTQYRFRVTNLTDPIGANAVQVLDRNQHWFSLTMLTRYNYGTTYQVEVAVKTNGSFSNYGSACTISSPTVPMLIDCNAVITSAGTLIVTSSVSHASSYRFEVTNMSSGNFETTVIDRAQNWFTFHLVPNFTPSAEYAVRVAVNTAGSWSPFGESCTITAPGAARQIAMDEKPIPLETEFSVLAYPNPYNDYFRLDLESAEAKAVEVKIYDMTGRLIASQAAAVDEIENLEWGKNLPSGVYTVSVLQGIYSKILRLIKR